MNSASPTTSAQRILAIVAIALVFSGIFIAQLWNEQRKHNASFETAARGLENFDLYSDSTPEYKAEMQARREAEKLAKWRQMGWSEERIAQEHQIELQAAILKELQEKKP